MNCGEARDLLPGLVYGDLSAQEAGAVDGHLQACAQCASEARALQQVRQLLRTVPGANVHVNMATVYRDASERSSQHARWWRRMALGVSGAAAALWIVVFAVRTEIRLEPHQVVIRWANPPADPQRGAMPAPASREVSAPSPEMNEPGKIQEQLTMFGELIFGHQQEIAQLQTQLQTLQNQVKTETRRWQATELDVAALSGSPRLKHK
jgi:hypothetical protein